SAPQHRGAGFSLGAAMILPQSSHLYEAIVRGSRASLSRSSTGALVAGMAHLASRRPELPQSPGLSRPRLEGLASSAALRPMYLPYSSICRARWRAEVALRMSWAEDCDIRRYQYYTCDYWCCGRA